MRHPDSHGPNPDSMARSFAALIDAFGDRIALVDETGRRISYADLAARADASAALLGAGRRLVAIEMENAVEPIAAYLGALRHGHPVLLLAPGSEPILSLYRPDFHYRSTARGWRLDTAHIGGDLHPDLALLLSTSGTTGAAKLVRLSLSAVDANARSIRTYLDIGADDRAITSLPLHYSYGLSVLNSHLAAGATLLLTDRSVIEPSFWDFFEREGGTSFAGVPHSYDLIERAGVRDRPLTTLKTLTQAGGRLRPDHVKLLADWASARVCRFVVMYGQTEATARMAYLPPRRLPENADCIGVAIPGGRFELIDDAGQPIAAALTTGELVYHGPNVMMGYALDRGDLAKGAEIGALHTGDLAERTEEGLYRIVGRRSRFCKPFGLRVSLDGVEAILGRQGVHAMVTGNDDLIAIAYRKGPDPADLLQDLAARLALPLSVFDVERRDELPILPTGKPDYRTVLSAAIERRTERSARDDRGFAASFSTLLNRGDVASDDSFETLEGDSLSYVNVAGEIDRRLGYLPTGWEKMTIATLDGLASGPPDDRRWFKWVDSDILLRALAICAVVLTHARFRYNLGGGADALMILAGYSLARFDMGRLTSTGGWSILRRFALRVVLPYYAILVGYSLLREPADTANFFLVKNYEGDFDSVLAVYWFIEALAQTLLLVAILFSLTAVRRFVADHPLKFAWIFLGAAIAIRVAAYKLLGHDALMNRTMDAILPLFALGFLLYTARSIAHRIACLLVALWLVLATINVSPFDGLISGWPHDIAWARGRWILACAIALAFVPRVPLPGWVARAVTMIAAISFSIYVVHMLPTHLLVWEKMGPTWLALPLSILLAFVFDSMLRYGRRRRSGVLIWLKARVQTPGGRSDR